MSVKALEKTNAQDLTVVENINNCVSMLSAEDLENVLSYMEFLLYKAGNYPVSSGIAEKRRELCGKYKGKMWISDDFDDPLDDFKEYM